MDSNSKSIKLEIGDFQLSANDLSFEINLLYKILEKGLDWKQVVSEIEQKLRGYDLI